MTIYKQMEYQMRLSEYETLAEGKDGGYEWKVLSLGTHPCGYVSIPKNHPFYGKNYWDIEDGLHEYWKFVPCRNNSEGIPGMYYPSKKGTRGAFKATRVIFK